MSYINIIILLFYAVFNNAFLLTHVNKIYFANAKHSNRKNRLLLNNINNINNINNNNNNTMNASENIFPSFYEFLRTHSIQNIKEHSEEEDDTDEEEDVEDGEDVETIKADFLNFKANLNETIENSETNRLGKDFANKLNSKHLKLLTAFSAIQWARTWIYEMVHINEFFPTFMYQDMYKLCDYGSVNVSKRYFYIGYYPPILDQRKGPYYIGAFEINPPEREFSARIIIQNPYYSVNNDYAKEHIINYKKELEALCVEATVFFKYSSLKNTSFERYYYSWLFEE